MTRYGYLIFSFYKRSISTFVYFLVLAITFYLPQGHLVCSRTESF